MRSPYPACLFVTKVGHGRRRPNYELFPLDARDPEDPTSLEQNPQTLPPDTRLRSLEKENPSMKLNEEIAAYESARAELDAERTASGYYFIAAA